MFLRKHFLDGKKASELEDILQNLRWVFGTRRGAGSFLANFGISDIGFRTPEEMVVALTSEIRENVRLYEPRVEIIDVDEDWDDEGKRSKLVIRLRMREASEKLAVIVDLRRKAFDVVAVKPGRSES